jgi:hypothetical protein
MEIGVRIDRDGPGVVQFDSGKVLARIRTAFLAFSSDGEDQLYLEFERFRTYLQDAAVPEPRRTIMEKQMRGKSLRNGPVYRFSIMLPDGTSVIGWTRRFSVHFKSELPLSEAMQVHMSRFLRALEVGELFCDTQTPYFSVPSHDYNEDWLLDPNVQL